MSPGYFFFLSPEAIIALGGLLTVFTGMLSVIFGFILAIRKTSRSNATGIKELRKAQLEIQDSVKEMSNGNHKEHDP